MVYVPFNLLYFVGDLLNKVLITHLIGVLNVRKPKPARHPNEERVGGREGGLSDKWSLSVLLTCLVG